MVKDQLSGLVSLYKKENQMNLSCVMIIDDSEADQYLCMRTIEEYNSDIKLLRAYDGQEALEILNVVEQKPDVIFLDINMPRMDGHEFLEHYNKREEDKSAVIVMLTSSNQERDKEKSRAYKCVKKYLLKPLDNLILDEIAALECS